MNADGTVNVTDAELVYNYSIGAGELTEAELILADMDGDGHITGEDACDDLRDHRRASRGRDRINRNDKQRTI